MTLYWRSCYTCSTDVTVYDPSPQRAYCAKHRPEPLDFDQWAEALKVGDLVYLQPVLAGQLSRSQWLIVDRDGDTVSVHVLGAPATQRDVRVTGLANWDLTPRPKYGALY